MYFDCIVYLFSVKKKEQLLKEKENTNVILTLKMLKTKSYEMSTDKFNEIHECLNYVCSLWNLSDKQYSSDDQCLVSFTSLK